jgi:hypothetical protein
MPIGEGVVGEDQLDPSLVVTSGSAYEDTTESGTVP